MPHEPLEIDVQHAYAAAEERALRLTKALILSEAQCLSWRNAHARTVTELLELREESNQLAARVRELGGDPDGSPREEDAVPGGEAHTTQPFSD